MVDDLDHGRACLLITGAPGAGKSSVSRLVGMALTRSAVLNGDAVNRMIVSGRVWALGEPADEAARQVRLCNDNLCRLAANFADAGFTPVIDWIVPDRQQLQLYHEALGRRRLLVVVLAPSHDVCRTRNSMRALQEQFLFDGYESLTGSMRSGFGRLGWWFDTSDLTTEETVGRILVEAAGRAAVGP